jgi:hypothetical protein
MKLPSLILMPFFLVTNHAFAAPASCYLGELAQYRPAVLETVVSLVDLSSEPGAVQQKMLAAVKDATDKQSRLVVVVSYAGNATGESLKVEFEGLIEAPLTDQQIIDNTIIKTFKAHQKCIREQHLHARQGAINAMQGILSSMPIQTARSEIAYAIASTVQSYAQSNRNLLLLHLSDGLQHAQGGRSFYGINKQARKIDTNIELKAFARDGATAPRSKPQGAHISLLWWGMLATPKLEAATSKPVYLDTATIGSFKTFWEQYVRSLGVEKVQIGTPHLLNPDLTNPLKQPL